MFRPGLSVFALLLATVAAQKRIWFRAANGTVGVASWTSPALSSSANIFWIPDVGGAAPNASRTVLDFAVDDRPQGDLYYSMIRELAADPLPEAIFQSQIGSVDASDLTGQQVLFNLFATSNATGAKAMTIDKVNGKIYYFILDLSNYIAFRELNLTTTFASSGLDGSNFTVIKSWNWGEDEASITDTTVTFPEVMHYNNGLIYYTDGLLQSINTLTVDGNTRQSVFNFGEYGWSCQTMALAPSIGKIFAYVTGEGDDGGSSSGDSGPFVPHGVYERFGWTNASNAASAWVYNFDFICGGDPQQMVTITADGGCQPAPVPNTYYRASINRTADTIILSFFDSNTCAGTPRVPSTTCVQDACCFVTFSPPPGSGGATQTGQSGGSTTASGGQSGRVTTGTTGVFVPPVIPEILTWADGNVTVSATVFIPGDNTCGGSSIATATTVADGMCHLVTGFDFYYRAYTTDASSTVNVTFYNSADCSVGQRAPSSVCTRGVCCIVMLSTPPSAAGGEGSAPARRRAAPSLSDISALRQHVRSRSLAKRSQLSRRGVNDLLISVPIGGLSGGENYTVLPNWVSGGNSGSHIDGLASDDVHGFLFALSPVFGNGQNTFSVFAGPYNSSVGYEILRFTPMFSDSNAHDASVDRILVDTTQPIPMPFPPVPPTTGGLSTTRGATSSSSSSGGASASAATGASSASSSGGGSSTAASSSSGSTSSSGGGSSSSASSSAATSTSGGAAAVRVRTSVWLNSQCNTLLTANTSIETDVVPGTCLLYPINLGLPAYYTLRFFGSSNEFALVLVYAGSPSCLGSPVVNHTFTNGVCSSFDVNIGFGTPLNFWATTTWGSQLTTTASTTSIGAAAGAGVSLVQLVLATVAVLVLSLFGW